MEKIEELTSVPHGLLVPIHGDEATANGDVVHVLRVLRREVIAQALKKLWQEMHLEGAPLIFDSPMRGRVQTQHHPLFLEQHVAAGARHKRGRLGELRAWSRLEAPPYAHGIAATGHTPPRDA